MILSLLVIGGSLAFLGWLVFNLAICALPCFVGVSAGMLAHGVGARAFGAVLVGFLAGILTVVVGRAILGGTMPVMVRTLVLVLFAGPAGVAGFGIARDIARLTGAGDAWGIAIGVAGAAVTMAAALARLLAVPEGAGLGGSARAAPLVAQRP